MAALHLPVLLTEVVDAFDGLTMRTFVDGTVGLGGHSAAILEAHPEIKSFLGIDQDPDALALASERLAPWSDKVRLSHGNFSELDRFIQEQSLQQVDGILVDLGVSSLQLDRPERGFSFSREGPLDMRMNPAATLTAAEIVNHWSEYDLARIFRDYGEEQRWRKAAQAIVAARAQKPITTTKELAAVLNPVLPYNPKKGINPLTLIFQGLRIAVNRELDVLETFLTKAIDLLQPGGRLAVISFHSLEDRIVKNHFRLAASDKWDTSGLGGGLFRDKEPIVLPITKKPLCASDEEVAANPRSRSAKLRVIEKL